MKKFLSLLCFMVLVAGIISTAGCTRQYYRKKADREVYSLLKQGSGDPRWKIDPQITPDGISRLFDPFDPDFEPAPTDDPAAHQKMHYVDGKRGSLHWHDNGNVESVENPCWRQYLLVNEKGEIPLDKEMAVDLSIRHSPEYQSAFENLYLAAMDVSRERFMYDVQFFGGDSILYTASGRLRGDNTTYGFVSQIENSSNFGAEKALATGGTWVAELANSITWTLTGRSSWDVNASLINVSLVQPLLRGANRKVVLERLTQAERDFLSEIRRMVLFQQGHYARVVTGSSTSFTGGPSGTNRAGIPASSGFYSLLRGQIQIQNQRQNIIQLEENLDRFNEMFRAGQVDDKYQVEEMKQNLLSSQSSLLQQANEYQSDIESYLRSLGLPPDLKVTIGDPLLEQFRLTSPTLIDLQEEVGNILAAIRLEDQPIPQRFYGEIKEIIQKTQGEIAILDHDLEALQKSIPKRLEGLKSLEETLKTSTEHVNPLVYDTQVFMDRIAQLRSADIPETLSRLRAAFTLLELISETKEETLRQMIIDHSFAQPIQDVLGLLKIERVSEDKRTPEERLLQQKKYESRLNELKATEETLAKDPSLASQRELERIRAKRVIEELGQKDIYRDWTYRIFSTFQYELITLSLLQTRARLDTMTIAPVLITAEEAFQTAADSRLDWMNQKARLVDQWRQIDITADRLKGDLQFTLSGSTGGVDRHGVHFGAKDSRIQAGMEWDSPLTRHNEMLDYRASQIEYQAARRDYYTYIDSVQAELRDNVRMVQLSQINFEISRNAVLTSAIIVDVMQIRMDRPGQRIDTSASDQLIRALNGLMQSQNALLNVWINYHTQRMLLDLNMGTMKLDARGHWVDPGMKGSALNAAPTTIETMPLDETLIKTTFDTVPNDAEPNVHALPSYSDMSKVQKLPVPKIEPPKISRRYVED